MAQLYLKHYPQRVQSLMLIASMPKFVASEDWPYAMSSHTFTKFVKQYDASPGATIKKFSALQALHSLSSKQIMRSLEQVALDQQPEKICWGLRWLQEFDLRDIHLSKDVPIYLLQGENDQVAFVEAAEHTVEIWTQVKLHKIPNAGHAPFLSHPDQFIEQVKTMLSQTENNENV